MARANVYNKDKVKSKKKKKILAISIPSGIVVLAGLVVLILWLCGVFDGTSDWFADYSDYKVNYTELETLLEDTENTFIFVYDSEELEDLEDYEDQIVAKVDRLINDIESINAKADANYFNFYIIDTTVSSNSDILENEDYGEITFTPQLMYLYDGVYYATMEEACEASANLDAQIPEEEKEHTFTNSTINSLIQSLNSAHEMIQSITI